MWADGSHIDCINTSDGMGIGWMFCFYPPKFPLNCVSNFLEGVNDKNIPYMLALWVESVSIGIGNTGPAFTWH